MERKALGKGISALIPERTVEHNEEKITFLPLGQIRPSSFQPRNVFDPDSMQELKQSVKEKGVLQPILVRPQGDYYEIIAGERRFRAASELNLERMPVIIKETQDQDALEISLIENIQRQELNAIEEAHAYQYLIDKYQVTQERISKVLGKARVTISNTLRLLKLPQEIQEVIKNGSISYAHGRTLLEVDDSNKQRLLAREVITNRLSVRELENLVKGIRRKKPRFQTKPLDREPLLSVLEEELQRALATKVKINKRKKRGQIVIEFYSKEDLLRIAAQLRGE